MAASPSRPTPPAPAETLLAPAEPLPWIDPYDVTYKRRWAALAALLLITVVVFYPALQASMLWGDEQAITQNPALRSWGALAYAAVHPRASTTFYHPLADALLTDGGVIRVCPDHGCDPVTGQHVAGPVPCVTWSPATVRA